MIEKRIPAGVTSFYELNNGDYVRVDKTDFIMKFHSGPKSIIIQRPRRSGKTSALSMLHHFYAAKVNNKLTENLFQNWNIYKNHSNFVQQHQGKYPVIFLSFANIKPHNFEEARYMFGKAMANACAEHLTTLKNSAQVEAQDIDILSRLSAQTLTENELQDSLSVLCRALSTHYNKQVIVLVDEFEAPVMSAAEVVKKDKQKLDREKDLYSEVSRFIKIFFSKALKDSAYVEKALMTCVFKIPLGDLGSGLNNFSYFSLLDDKMFSSCFGLVQAEVTHLLDSRGIKKEEYIVPIKDWYGNYKVGDCELYNIYSVMECLARGGSLEPFWIRTADEAPLRKHLSAASYSTKERLAMLLLGKKIKVTLNGYVDPSTEEFKEAELWTLLVSTGYLQVEKKETMGTRYSCELSIPNKEISDGFKSLISQWVDMESYDDVIGNLLRLRTPECIRMLMEQFDNWKNKPEQKNADKELYLEFIYALAMKLKITYPLRGEKNDNGSYYISIKHNLGNNKQAILLELKRVDTNLNVNQAAQESLVELEQNAPDIFARFASDDITYMRPEDVSQIVIVISPNAIGSATKNTNLSNKKIKSPTSGVSSSMGALFHKANGPQVNFTFSPVHWNTIVDFYSETETKKDFSNDMVNNNAFQTYVSTTLKFFIEVLNADLYKIYTSSTAQMKKVYQDDAVANVKKFKMNLENKKHELMNFNANSMQEHPEFVSLRIISTFQQLLDDTFSIVSLEPEQQAIAAPEDPAMKAREFAAESCFIDMIEKIKNVLVAEKFHPRIFPSYSWNDTQKPLIVRTLYRYLKAAGFNAVIDIVDNRPGTSIDKFVEQIGRVDFIILCCDTTLKEKCARTGNVVGMEVERILDVYKMNRERVFTATLDNESGSIPAAFKQKVFALLHGENFYQGVIDLISIICKTNKEVSRQVEPLMVDFNKSKAEIKKMDEGKLIGLYQQYKKKEEEDRMQVESSITASVQKRLM